MRAMEEAMFKVVRDVLKKHDGNRKAACHELGITYRTMTNYLVRWPDLRKYVTTPKERELPGNYMWERYPDE